MNYIIRNFLFLVKRFIEIIFKIKISRNQSVNKLTRVPDVPHAKIFPIATYSPWKCDLAFQDIFKEVRNYSLIDEFRMYEIYTLAKQVAPLDGVFLEVGVWRGGSSALIQRALSDSKVSKRFYIADTFEGVVKAGSEKDTVYVGGEHADASLKDVQSIFTAVQEPLPQILVGMFPDDHQRCAINRLAFLHCDVDAYESTKGVVEWCTPKMVQGGVIVVDDFGFRGCEGVTRYINELMMDNETKSKFLFIHNLNGHAILVKR